MITAGIDVGAKTIKVVLLEDSTKQLARKMILAGLEAKTTLDQVFANEQVLARGMQIGLTRDDGVQVPGVANPIVFSGTPLQYDQAPPRLGDGTEKVLAEKLGLGADAIAQLRKDGVIG